MITDVTVGQQVRRMRKAHGITQKNAALYLGVSAQQLQKYEAGKNRLSAAQLYQLARLFACPMEALCSAQNPVSAMPPEKHELAKLVRDFCRIPSQHIRREICYVVRVVADSCDASNPPAS